MESKPSTPKSPFDTLMNDVTDRLKSMEHWGVLGMKWGVRKDDRGRTGGATKGQIANNKRKKDPPVVYHHVAIRGQVKTIAVDPSKVTIAASPNGSLKVSGRDKKEVQRVLKEIDPDNDYEITETKVSKDGKKEIQKESNSSNDSQSRPVSNNSRYRPISNEELNERISRLRLEQEYNRLTTPAPTAGQKFKERIASDLISAGSQVLVKSVAVPIAMKGINSMMGTNLKAPDLGSKKDKKKDSENNSFLSALASADEFDQKVAEKVKKSEKTTINKLPDLGARHDKNDTAKHGTADPSFFDFQNTFKKDNKLSSDEVDTSDVYVDYLEKYGFEDVPYVDLDKKLTFKP